MSKYTTELRYICETEAGLSKSVGYNDVESVIANSREKIFSFDYPCWDESYKETLETKIIKHFYTREIAYETYGLWKLKLDMKMNEIMPYYNKLYESETIEFNPLWDVDYTNHGTVAGNGTINKTTATTGNTKTNFDETQTTDSTTTESGKSNVSEDTEHSGSDSTTGHSHGWTLRSDTPQGGLQNFIPDKESDDDTIDKYIYLTDAVETIGDTTGSGSNSSNDARTGTTTSEGNTVYDEDGTRNYTQTTDNTQNANQDTTSTNAEESENRLYGKRSAKSYSEMLEQYRDTFLNIDMMVIEALEPLFMQIW